MSQSYLSLNFRHSLTELAHLLTMYLYIHLIVVSITVNICSCWQYFTVLNDLKLTNSAPRPVVQHSEYNYGDCRRDTNKFYGMTHVNHIDILGKPIVRGWIDVPRIPVCIRLQARSYEEDTFRSTGFNFQFCVPRLTFAHSHNRWQFYFYEWFIPLNFEGGMNWDIYFFGPDKHWW